MTVYDNTVPPSTASTSSDWSTTWSTAIRSSGAPSWLNISTSAPVPGLPATDARSQVLLNHVFDGDKLSEDDIAGVVNAITTLRNGHES